jgi:hypothetical protein
MKINFQFLYIGALADVYLHMPRGSNNRLNEHTAGRNNANRIFDSQNNNQGGYNVGDKLADAAESEADQSKAIYFQSGKDGISEMSIEWTNQHGCGQLTGSDAHSIDCQIVLQYTCQDTETSTMKNGFSRKTSDYTPPRNDESFEKVMERKNQNYEKAPNSGEHETWEYYDACYQRKRNTNLFTADQDRFYNRGSANTRQNPNGARSGYECPEERDYFPYWHPTPWIDIAILTSQTNNCNYYKTESANRKPRFECIAYFPDSGIRKHASQANNEQDCNETGGEWTGFYNYLEIVPDILDENDCKNRAQSLKKTFDTEVIWDFPNLDGLRKFESPEKKCLLLPEEIECDKVPWSRANHLGDSGNDNANYKWKLPHFHYNEESKDCALRIRYNISSNDYPEQFDPAGTSTYHQIQKLDNDPVVELYPKLQLQLAIDTAEIARTFQDRSHLFQLHKRPQSISDTDKIFNVQVRGRRGNIVQAFPAVEYDFVPTHLSVSSSDLVHFQWEGSNSQPNTAGEGKDKSDRHNIVTMDAPGLNIPHGLKSAKKTFTVEYNDGQITYEYYKILNVDIHEARIMCKQLGMNLPEPSDQKFNDALVALRQPENKDLHLGISDEKMEGIFRYDTNGGIIEWENWKVNEPNDFRGAEDFTGLLDNGQWNDHHELGRMTAVCMKPYEYEAPREEISMFQNVEWIWSSLDENNLRNSNENLLIQMASSGYYSCKNGCTRSFENEEIEVLQNQLDNAPASFGGNVVRFQHGQYYYMCTRNNNFSNRAQKADITVTP